jgi:vancomycin resistance protein YoaR
MGSHSPDTLAVSPQVEKQIIDQERLMEKLKEELRNRRKKIMNIPMESTQDSHRFVLPTTAIWLFAR